MTGLDDFHNAIHRLDNTIGQSGESGEGGFLLGPIQVFRERRGALARLARHIHMDDPEWLWARLWVVSIHIPRWLRRLGWTEESVPFGDYLRAEIEKGAAYWESERVVPIITNTRPEEKDGG